MKPLRRDWVEVYLSTDYKEFLRKQILLREAGLKFQAKTRKNTLRFTVKSFFSKAVGNSDGGSSVKDYYVILVNKKDAPYAIFILE
ncbi:MAG: hypothetical protein LKJ17_08000 [Oscillospiraceae bacterium]|nr:hypothetical protein [Oscillospiraceae bacterium]